MHINFQGFLDSLLILVQGWAGIFVVICIIWAVVAILNNVTGDAYTYGRMVGHTTVTEEPIYDENGEQTGTKENYKTSWSLENRNVLKFNEKAGYAGKTGDLIGAVAGKNGLIISIVQLSEYQVSPADFFERDGRYYVTVKGRTYAVADSVECYKTATKSWFDQEDGMDRLRACLAFSSKLTVYIDPVGDKVRIITAN